MKRKILALACAMTLVFGMGISVSAAGSATASATAGDVANNATQTNPPQTNTPQTNAPQTSTPAAAPASGDVLMGAGENASGQVITAATLQFFASTTTVSGVPGASISAVSAETAKAMIAQAKTIAGSNTFIAALVDLNVPAGTGAATFTLGCPNVWKGQDVTILHMKGDGSFENIAPSVVEDNKVTFTMTSYSPVAIVINTGSTGAKSPKTGEIFSLVAAMAAISGVGAAACGRKAKKS